MTATAAPLPLTDAEEKRLRRLVERGPQPPAEPRRRSPGAGIERELGAVVLRPKNRGKGGPYRFVKVAMSGPHHVRWRRVAVVNWERVHGPVPPGKVVIAKDGDALNDALDNLMLGTLDDALFLSHRRGGFNSNSDAQRAATAESNRFRAAARRMRGAMPDHWYLVDLDRRRIWNTAATSRWSAIEAAVTVPAAVRAINGRGWYATLAGWPHEMDIAAVALGALAAAGTPLPLGDVIARASEELQRVGLTAPMLRHTWYCLAVRLRRSGAITTKRRGPSSAWSITRAAVLSRQSSTRLVPLPGREVIAERFSGFAWVNDRGNEYQRERGDWDEIVARALAAANVGRAVSG